MAYTPYYSGGWQNNEEGGTPINAAALNNMESGIGAAVQRTGDTMTGNLTVQGNLYPSVILKPTNNDTTMRGIVEGSYSGNVALSIYEDSSGNNRRMVQVQSASSASSLDNALILRDGVNGTITNYRVFHSGMATPVPVANGGTGANSAAGARTSLDIEKDNFSASVTLIVGAAHAIFTRFGKLCHINYQSALLSTLDNPLVSTSQLFVLPVNYRPAEQFAAPFTVNALGFGNVTINTSGVVTIANITPNLTDGRIYLNCCYTLA